MQRIAIILACFSLPMAIGINCLSQSAGTGGIYPFIHHPPREGLVNNKARFIFQDSRGKLFIATFGGLSVYDGSRFTNFDYNNGLGNNLINDIVEMGDDSVWIMVNANKIN